MIEKIIEKDKPIILFDGVCNFCNSSVNFIINRDSEKKILFASLQSETGQKLLKQFNLPTENFTSLVLVSGDEFFTKSDAGLRIAKMLDGGWKTLYITKIIPRFIRNFIYDLIANNRYKIFGKSDHCMLPTKEVRERFLN